LLGGNKKKKMENICQDSQHPDQKFEPNIIQIHVKMLLPDQPVNHILTALKFRHVSVAHLASSRMKKQQTLRATRRPPISASCNWLFLQNNKIEIIILHN
jgi:hypothetical protein